MKPEMNRSKYRYRDFSRPVLVPQVIKQRCVLHGGFNLNSVQLMILMRVTMLAVLGSY